MKPKVLKTKRDHQAALAHIERYGVGHSECIVTEDYSAAMRFLNEVDAACAARRPRSQSELDKEAQAYALGLVEDWIEDPSNVRLLRIGMDLWPDTSRLRGNYWTLEPAIAINARNGQTFFIDTTAPVAHYINDKKQSQRSQENGSFWGGQALSDVRYRNILIRQVLDVDSRNKDDLDYRGKTDRRAKNRLCACHRLR